MASCADANDAGARLDAAWLEEAAVAAVPSDTSRLARAIARTDAAVSVAAASRPVDAHALSTSAAAPHEDVPSWPSPTARRAPRRRHEDGQEVKPIDDMAAEWSQLPAEAARRLAEAAAKNARWLKARTTDVVPTTPPHPARDEGHYVRTADDISELACVGRRAVFSHTQSPLTTHDVEGEESGIIALACFDASTLRCLDTTARLVASTAEAAAEALARRVSDAGAPEAVPHMCKAEESLEAAERRACESGVDDALRALIASRVKPITPPPRAPAPAPAPKSQEQPFSVSASRLLALVADKAAEAAAGGGSILRLERSNFLRPLAGPASPRRRSIADDLRRRRANSQPLMGGKAVLAGAAVVSGRRADFKLPVIAGVPSPRKSPSRPAASAPPRDKSTRRAVSLPPL